MPCSSINSLVNADFLQFYIILGYVKALDARAYLISTPAGTFPATARYGPDCGRICQLHDVDCANPVFMVLQDMRTEETANEEDTGFLAQARPVDQEEAEHWLQCRYSS